MVPKMNSIWTRMIKNMPQAEQATGSGAAGGPGKTQAGKGTDAVRPPPERKALRLDPQSTPKFHGLARLYPAFKEFWNQNVNKDHFPVPRGELRRRLDRARSRSNLQANKKEV